MAAGDVLRGRRVEDGARWYGDHREPGDYGRVSVDGQWEWRAMTPNGLVGNLSAHDVELHDDGTVTVSPSILTGGGTPERSWHGYLERGVWREV